MKDWHTCDTTHCRGGWAIHFGGEAGKLLEQQTDSLFAAMLIFKESSTIPVSLHKFFDSNEVAMEDMRRCAEEEIALQNSQS